MMTYRMHFEVDGMEDFVVLEADTIEEIRRQAIDFCADRGLTPAKNNLWSEEVKEAR